MLFRSMESLLRKPNIIYPEYRNTHLDQPLLTLALLPNSVVIWMEDSSGMKSVSVKTDSEKLRRQAWELRRLLGDRRTSLDEIKISSSRLYMDLLQPVGGWIGQSGPLRVDMDSELAHLPIGMLYDGRNFLAQRRQISVIQSGLSNRKAEGRVDWHEASALLVSDPRLPDSARRFLPVLPQALEEARMVGGKFVKQRLLVGDGATLRNLEMNLPFASVLHYAGHSIVTSGGPALVLSGSQIKAALLNADAISKWDLRGCRLAVLSACATDAGASESASRPEGLASAFLVAGVESVVGTRWPVDSEATRLFMGKFYDVLLGGASVSEALQGAAAFVRLSPGMEHPYYWAAFECFRAV